jgi:uncharacterized protein (TIGR02271 family)
MITQEAIGRVFGTDVYSTDGDKIGSARQVYLDNETGDPAWVSVSTGLFGTKESFVPLQDANLNGNRLEVPFDKDRVKNAPRIDADGDLARAEEDELYRYYGVGSTGDRFAGTTVDGGEQRDTGQRAFDEVERGGTVGRHSERGGTVGHDTSGPTTDDAMTRSEERLVAGTRTEQAGKARLRKYVVTEQQQVTVPVTRDEARVEREPITDANLDQALDGPTISEEEHEVTLEAERPVATTEAVPVERVRLGTETVTDQETVSGEVRKEQIEFDDGTGDNADRR